MKLRFFLIILALVIISFVTLGLLNRPSASEQNKENELLPRAEEANDIVLTVVTQGVKVIKNNVATTVVVTTTLAVGDIVVTDATGRAQINFYGANEATLNYDTKLVIAAAIAPTNIEANNWKIKLQLEVGEVWNRLAEFLHPDALYAIESGDVVATVRGTIFNVAYRAGKVQIGVIKNQVAVSRATTALVNVRTGQLVELASGVKPAGLQAEKAPTISSLNVLKNREADWFSENLARDAVFNKILIKRDAPPLPKNETAPESESVKPPKHELEITPVQKQDIQIKKLDIQKQDIQKPAAVARKLIVTALPINISVGDSAKLFARIEFSNNETKDVTDQTKWAIGPDDLTGAVVGKMNGNSFTATDARGGKAFILGLFTTDDGRVLRDSAEITVLSFN